MVKKWEQIGKNIDGEKGELSGDSVSIKFRW